MERILNNQAFKITMELKKNYADHISTKWTIFDFVRPTTITICHERKTKRQAHFFTHVNKSAAQQT